MSTVVVVDIAHAEDTGRLDDELAEGREARGLRLRASGGFSSFVGRRQPHRRVLQVVLVQVPVEHVLRVLHALQLARPHSRKAGDPAQSETERTTHHATSAQSTSDHSRPLICGQNPRDASSSRSFAGEEIAVPDTSPV